MRNTRYAPRTALRVLTELSRRLRRADAVIGNLALLDVYGRLAGKLRELALSDGEETEEGIVVRQRPTQAEIAAMIGSVREVVQRALKTLEHVGLVQMRRGRIQVIDVEALDGWTGSESNEVVRDARISRTKLQTVS